MYIFRKIKNFLLFNNEMRLLHLEALFYLGYARLLKSLPFSKIMPLLGVSMDKTSINNFHSNSNRKLLEEISSAIHLMSRFTLWESQCLVKAIAAMKMLEKRRIESILYLGTTKDRNGKLIAHAWLRSGNYYLTGAEEMNKFAVVYRIAKLYSNQNEGELNGNQTQS
ncbi:lasso peptide biosynthesis B2 protein [Neobacillus drentensis]|uniref:lasso peptide biosynthesis B2 protein n=1 Tax=Neobacillus drentensis TaxID=220684 RepID=UPI002FFF7F83